METAGASITLTHTSLSGDQALGGLGGAGGLGGNGGNTSPGFVDNGFAGAGGAGGAGGLGGDGLGGGLHIASGDVQVVQSDLTQDLAQGGAGGKGGNGGNAGAKRNGRRGPAGSGGAGGNGGSGYGGAIYITDGSLHVVSGSFAHDQALAGAAGAGGARGTGSGGSAGSAGAAGQGVGGAVYIAGGTVEIGVKTTFANNFATTSDDDVFGPFTTP
jgi:hypothetical protein